MRLILLCLFLSRIWTGQDTPGLQSDLSHASSVLLGRAESPKCPAGLSAPAGRDPGGFRVCVCEEPEFPASHSLSVKHTV